MTHPLANRETRTALNYAFVAKGIPVKVCSRCLAVKPLSAFTRYRSSSDGLQSYCRVCKAGDHAQRYESDPEYRARHNANAIRWAKANPGRVSELTAARNATRRIRHAGRVQDPNILKRCAGRCGRLLPETDFRLDRGTQDGLRTTCRNCTTDCRRQCRQAHGNPDGQTCYLCGDPISRAADAWVDHVTPRSKGGTDDPGNLRWTHSACNMQRQAQPLTAEQQRRLDWPPLAA